MIEYLKEIWNFLGGFLKQNNNVKTVVETVPVSLLPKVIPAINNSKENIKLTTNYTFNDLTITGHSSLQKENRKLGLEHISQMKKMAETLEIINAKYPLIISCSFRCPNLNKAVGSTDASQHLYGNGAGATDFGLVNSKLEEVYEWIYKDSGLKFHQLILEYNSANKKQWIHIGLPKGYNDGQVFKLDPETKKKIVIKSGG